jgi:tol-pal system protein YbgF
MRLSVRTIGLTIGLLGIALLTACAHRQTNQAEIDQLNRLIEALRVQNIAYAKQVEELENRIFILSDRLESRKINDEKVEIPKLPTVALHPTPVAVVPTTSVPAGTETDAEPEIEYVGEAAKPSSHRPVLRLHGDSAEVSIIREPTPGPPAIRVIREGSPHASKEENPEAIALYRKSFEALRAGKHDEAVKGFNKFMHAFPSHDLADNSQYWLGECFYDRKDYTAAVREFRKVIEHYPNGNKVPDAMLKVGYSYLSLGSIEAGRQTLTQLQRSYPRNEAAVRAGTRLAELDRSNPVRASSESTSVAPTLKSAHISEEAP